MSKERVYSLEDKIKSYGFPKSDEDYDEKEWDECQEIEEEKDMLKDILETLRDYEKCVPPCSC